MPHELPKIGAPALRALASVGIHSLSSLTGHTEKELLALHGMGPKALGILRAALHEHGLSFSEERPQAEAGETNHA